jgi:hypothetical protein
LAVLFIPDSKPTGEQWLAIGLVIALIAIAGLTIAVLALARKLAVSRNSLVDRETRPGGGDRLVARPLADLGHLRTLAAVRPRE